MYNISNITTQRLFFLTSYFHSENIVQLLLFRYYVIFVRLWLYCCRIIYLYIYIYYALYLPLIIRTTPVFKIVTKLIPILYKRFKSFYIV